MDSMRGERVEQCLDGGWLEGGGGKENLRTVR